MRPPEAKKDGAGLDPCVPILGAASCPPWHILQSSRSLFLLCPALLELAGSQDRGSWEVSAAPLEQSCRCRWGQTLLGSGDDPGSSSTANSLALAGQGTGAPAEGLARSACPPAASSPPAPCCRSPRRQSCGRPCWRGQPGTPGRQRQCTLGEETQQVRGTHSCICPGSWGVSEGQPVWGSRAGAGGLDPYQGRSMAEYLELPWAGIWKARHHIKRMSDIRKNFWS